MDTTILSFRAMKLEAEKSCKHPVIASHPPDGGGTVIYPELTHFNIVRACQELFIVKTSRFQASSLEVYNR